MWKHERSQQDAKNGKMGGSPTLRLREKVGYFFDPPKVTEFVLIL